MHHNETNRQPFITLRPVTTTRLSLWIPVVVWAAVIFAFSAIPGLGTGLGDWDLVLRKIAHLAEYALLGVLLYRATRSAPVAIAIGSLYAMTDEFHQSFVRGRHASPIDWAIDTVGVVAGVALFAWHRRR